MFKAVIFDLGEVLSSPPSLFSALAERVGATDSSLAPHYWTGRDAYDAGATPRQYWAPLLEATGAVGDDELFQVLADLDAELWADIRPSARALLRDCRASGVTVAVLSNAPHAMQKAAEDASWQSDVDHLFISATMSLVKPDPAIYAAVTARLGLSASEIAFIDDKEKNVDAARAAGWAAHLWVDDTDTRAWLGDLGIL